MGLPASKTPLIDPRSAFVRARGNREGEVGPPKVRKPARMRSPRRLVDGRSWSASFVAPALEPCSRVGAYRLRRVRRRDRYLVAHRRRDAVAGFVARGFAVAGFVARSFPVVGFLGR